MTPTKVYTETICEMCGEINRREGAEGEIPPVKWAKGSLTIRLEGSGWTNNISYIKSLCPRCAEKVRLLISPNEFEGE